MYVTTEPVDARMGERLTAADGVDDATDGRADDDLGRAEHAVGRAGEDRAEGDRGRERREEEEAHGRLQIGSFGVAAISNLIFLGVHEQFRLVIRHL